MPGLISCTWDEVPHLDEKTKQELADSYPPHMRDARTKGVPLLGPGAVYPISEDEIIWPDFEIPEHWPRGYALDVGWNRTATIWGAYDRQNDIAYFYGEHYQGRATPHEHAEAIKARGAWMQGAADPASHGSSQIDGRKIIELYRAEGLDLIDADNDVEAGIFDVWQRLRSGRLKIFKSLVNWRQEFRLYRRNDKGKIVKPDLPPNLPLGKNAAQYGDHLMDAARYWVRTWLPSTGTARGMLRVAPPKQRPDFPSAPRGQFGWMA
jgi:hypothetical protein